MTKFLYSRSKIHHPSFPINIQLPHSAKTSSIMRGGGSENRHCKNVYPSIPLETSFLLTLWVVKHARNNPQREKRNPLAGEKIRKTDYKIMFHDFLRCFALLAPKWGWPLPRPGSMIAKIKKVSSPMLLFFRKQLTRSSLQRVSS